MIGDALLVLAAAILLGYALGTWPPHYRRIVCVYGHTHRWLWLARICTKALGILPQQERMPGENRAVKWDL